MNNLKLQDMFGKSPAKIYVFTGDLPEGKSPSSHITEAFALAAETNLVTGVVSHIQDSWILYTKDDVDLSSSEDFRFLVELPLPEPEPVLEDLSEDSSESGGL